MEKIILFDIDGTLIDNGSYPENFSNIKKQIDMMKKDFTIGICTYRPFDANVKNIIEDYGLNGPIIVEGGACIFKKGIFKYNMVFHDGNITPNLNSVIRNIILDYIKLNHIKLKVKVTNNFTQDDSAILINGSRKMSSTIRFPQAFSEQIDSISQLLKSDKNLSGMTISQSYNNELKINVFSENINKISTMENYLKNASITFISDFEEVLPATKSPFIKVFSVGTNVDFNKYCDCVFSSFGKGVEEILINLGT